MRAHAKQYLGKLALNLKAWAQKYPNTKFQEEYNKIRNKTFPIVS